MVYDVASGVRRQITFGEGSNESPAFAPNGRHLAFTLDAAGKTQVFLIGRDGRGLTQVTSAWQQLHAQLVTMTAERRSPRTCIERETMMKRMKRLRSGLGVLTLAGALVSAACATKQPPVARAVPPPGGSGMGSGSGGAGTGTGTGTGTGGARPPAPPEPVSEPRVTPEPVVEDVGLDAKSLDDLNRDSPLQPVFFDFDSAELTPGRAGGAHAERRVLKKYATWMITIEGHCDERGTAEYNLALGERRALAASAYLVSLGIPASRLRTVSYGKEFPFDTGRTEAAYAKNRRAHFVITAK